MIYTGQVITIPDGASTPAPAPAPAPEETAPAPSGEVADMVICNGAVVTMVSEGDQYEALAIKDGVICYVGDNAGAQALIGEDDQPELYTRNADQAVSVYEMLKMYTSNAAYAGYLSDRVGTIEVGKKADLVILGQNILTCDVKAVSDTTVDYTISNGRIVYKG